MTDLRTLAQAVVDAVDAFHAASREAWPGKADERLRAAANEASALLGRALCLPNATQYTARAILAALDAERAQGYARAMGEVVEHLDSLSDAAVATYQEHRTEYADGVADGSVEAWQAVRKLAERD